MFVCGDNGGHPYFQNEERPRGYFGPNVDPNGSGEFRGGKWSVYEGGLRIPFIVRWPGKIEPGQVSDHLCYLSKDLGETTNAAAEYPEIVNKMTQYCKRGRNVKVRKEERMGEVFDASKGFMRGDSKKAVW